MELLRREPDVKAPVLAVISLFLVKDAAIGKDLQVLRVGLLQAGLRENL